MTVDDPKAYTKAYTVRIPHTLLADADIFEMFDENEKDCARIKIEDLPRPAVDCF